MYTYTYSDNSTQHPPTASHHPPNTSQSSVLVTDRQRDRQTKDNVVA